MTAQKLLNGMGLILAALFLHATLNAQVPTSGNIFFGYSYAGGDVHVPSSPEVQGSSHTAALNGWEGSLEGKFLPWVGIVADFAGQYGSHNVHVCSFVVPPCGEINVNARRYTVMFGPRVSISVGKFTPFAHAMIGAAHINEHGGPFSDTHTSLATAIGGGLDYKLIKGLAWRLQGDELHTHFFGFGQDHFRFSTGIVLRF